MRKTLAFFLSLAMIGGLCNVGAAAMKEDDSSSTRIDCTVTIVDENGNTDSLNHYLGDAFVTYSRTNENYTVFFSLTDDASDYISAVSYGGGILSIDGNGYYAITVSSVSGLVPVTFTISQDDGFESTVYFSFDTSASDGTGEDGGSVNADGTNGSTGNDSDGDSGLLVTIPEGLADGVYTGDATVEPDDDDGFTFYPITVSVTIADGAIESFSVTGAAGQNTQYSYRAETGINEQLSGATAGSCEVDAVATATCSSAAIVEALNAAFGSNPIQTTYELGEAIYDPDGTSVTLTICNPREGVDYSDISIACAAGKCSGELIAGTDYMMTLLSSGKDTIVYQITILPSDFEITGDDLTRFANYNVPGMCLDVTVAGSSAGRITIISSAAVTLENNTLVLTGGNGETLADYIRGIDEVTVEYTEENGEEISATYSTKRQHGTEPEYTPDDIFGEDGSIQFACGIFSYGEEGTYTLTLRSNGFEDLTAVVGAAAVAGTNEACNTDTDAGTDESSADNDATDNEASGNDNTADETTGNDATADETTDDRAAGNNTAGAEAFKFDDDNEEGSWTWAASGIYALYAAGVLHGYEVESGGTGYEYRPDNSLTRAEAAKMIALAYNLDVEEGDAESVFADVADSHWAAAYINACYAAGIVEGRDSGDFDANETITRAEMAAMIARAENLVLIAGAGSTFTDTVGHWGSDYIEACTTAGLVEGTGKDMYEPDAEITRAQTAVLVARAMGLIASANADAE